MWVYARIAIFALATALLAIMSRASLLRPRSHGFYRFFVFEAILALILLNLPRWFSKPFAWHQVISWFLLMIAFIPLISGVSALHVHGRGGASPRQEPELLAFERTSNLVHEGIFRYIRHPMYSSLLLLAWGVFFKSPSVPGAALAGVSTAGLIVMALMEERENIRTFGQQYRDYMLHTRRFIPYVF